MAFSAAQIALIATTLFYFTMNGAQIFETAVLIPLWTASPPSSFAVFRGPHGLDLKTFWIFAHSVHEVSFILAIFLCWRLDVRNALLVIFALHMAVRVWTLGYFAPEIISFQQLADAEPTLLNKADLFRRVTQWKHLNVFRVTTFVALSLALIPVCIRSFR
jgi:hypothetical protein